MEQTEYAARLAAYGFTAEDAAEAAARNHRILSAINTVNTAGRKRGTVDHAQDRATFLASVRSGS